MFRCFDFDGLGITGQQSELIELTLSYGFKGFDLDLGDFSRQVEHQGIDRARRLIDSARLTLGSFPLPIDWEADEEAFQRDLEKLPALVELASQIGCRRTRAVLRPASELRPLPENFELCRRRFGQLAQVLAPFDIRIGLGFMAPLYQRQRRAYEFVHTFDQLLLLVKSIGEENVGVCLDTWHWHVSGGSLDHIRALTAQDAVMLDVADATTPAGHDDVIETDRTLPSATSESDTMMIDIPAIMVILAELGFDGPVTLKPDVSQFGGARRDEIVRQCRESMDALWSGAGLSKKGKLVRSQS